MKKIEYLTPETEVVELMMDSTLLAGSDPNSAGGSGEKDDDWEDL